MPGEADSETPRPINKMPLMTEQPTVSNASAATLGTGGVPERPSLDGLEAKWSQHWREQQTYSFVRPESREQVFSIDTPPPTVSGSLHVGHVFSYTHTDLIARYQRMQGKHVFYAGSRSFTEFVATPRCPTIPTSLPRPSPTPSARCRSVGATSSSCATN